jgi:long-chain acyl-CoA synthetase
MNSPLEYFLHWEKNKPDAVLLRQPFDGVWKTWTWKEAGLESRKIAQKLADYNFPPGTHIALLSKNCAHWVMSDLAIMMAGHVSIPLYPTLGAETIRQILVHSESKAIIIGKLDDYRSQQSGIPSTLKRLSIGSYGHQEEDLWEDVVNAGKPRESLYTFKPDDLLTIIYTSGTTGVSKGVMHTAGAFDHVMKTFSSLIPLPREKIKMFSYLPLSHVAERVGIEVFGLFKGATISFAESLDTFAQNLEDTQPSMFFAVPRIWAKFQEKILAKMPQPKLDRLLKIPLLNSVVRNKLKKKLGLSEAQYIVSAAAPISVNLINWFQTLGITIYQAYGMTEDCVVSHFNLPGQNRVGTVGRALPGVLTKISEEGEIRIKNQCLMKGYYKEPELTAATFDAEGYLKTGDMAEYDPDGYLKITGRVKDQFKTDKGKYISPAPIEMMLLKNTDIELVCVVGMGVPQPIALVVLSALGKARSKNEITESLGRTLQEVNALLEKVERLETAVIMKNDWSIANGLLTPTLKVKRNEVEKIHLPNYPKWYGMQELVVWE